jgi:hypothetical protein
MALNKKKGFDCEESIPPAYVAWRAGLPNRVVVPAHQAGNRFLGFSKDLQTLALGCFLPFPISPGHEGTVIFPDHLAASDY